VQFKVLRPIIDLNVSIQTPAGASEGGQAEAQFKLGVFYEHGRGVTKDQFMATEWYSEAAEQGEANAQFALGVCVCVVCT